MTDGRRRRKLSSVDHDPLNDKNRFYSTERDIEKAVYRSVHMCTSSLVNLTFFLWSMSTTSPRSSPMSSRNSLQASHSPIMNELEIWVKCCGTCITFRYYFLDLDAILTIQNTGCYFIFSDNPISGLTIYAKFCMYFVIYLNHLNSSAPVFIKLYLTLYFA